MWRTQARTYSDQPQVQTVWRGGSAAALPYGVYTGAAAAHRQTALKRRAEPTPRRSRTTCRNSLAHVAALRGAQ